MLIKHAHILTMEAVDYPDGFLQWNDGKIIAIGNACDAPEDDTVTDAAGRYLLPGFVDAHCHLGMWDDGLGFEGDDGNEETEPVTPQLRALDAVNSFDDCFAEARSAGVTTVLTGPGSANPIAGQWLAMKTLGGRIEDSLVAEPIGIKFALGENPKNTYNAKNQQPMTRMATAALIREQLQKALRYRKDKQASLEDDELDEPEFDSKCEALLPVLNRECKAFFHVHRADDIFTAIRIAKEFSLDYVLVHATEGYLVADALQRENAPIIMGPLLCDRSKPELKKLTPKAPALLFEAGVHTAICTDHPVIPIQYLALAAAIAHREGLPAREALLSITMTPARLAGLDHRVGSLTVGKDADFLLFDQHPMESLNEPVAVWIDGNPVKEMAL